MKSLLPFIPLLALSAIVLFVATRPKNGGPARIKHGVGVLLAIIGALSLVGQLVIYPAISSSSVSLTSVALAGSVVALGMFLAKRTKATSPMEIAHDRSTSHEVGAITTPTERQTASSHLNTMLDSPFKRVAALIAGLGLAMLLIGWLQIVARFWQFWSCIRVMIDHILLDDTSYMLFTYGFYSSLVGLVGSVFYNRTIGRVVSWVRTGTTL